MEYNYSRLKYENGKTAKEMERLCLMSVYCRNLLPFSGRFPTPIHCGAVVMGKAVSRGSILSRKLSAKSSEMISRSAKTLHSQPYEY
jgi:hypothetical protein